MTRVINESKWTSRRERAPLVWKVEKVEPTKEFVGKVVLIEARPREVQKSENGADAFGLAA